LVLARASGVARCASILFQAWPQIAGGIEKHFPYCSTPADGAGFPGAHSQAATLDELNENLKEVVEMLLEEGEPELEGEFVGTQNIVVA
jgi:hypothetical protein